MDESNRTPENAQRIRKSKKEPTFEKPVNFKLPRKKLNYIKQYCIDNYLSLDKFFNILLVNVFLKKRFIVDPKDPAQIHMSPGLVKILKLLSPDTPLSEFVLQAVDELFKDASLLPDPQPSIRIIQSGKKLNRNHNDNAYRLRKTYEKRRKNPPRILTLK